MNRRRVFILFHGRFPSEKAAALFAAENARSLSSTFDVHIVVPGRLGNAADSYQLPESVRINRIPVIDLFPVPILSKAAFAVSMCCYTFGAYVFLLRARAGDIVISNDPLPGLAATCTPVSVVYEVHDYPERWKWLYKVLFNRSALVIATNEWKRGSLVTDFPTAAGQIRLERNGVDLTAFGESRDRTECRAVLALPSDLPIVMYTGHLYRWKGVDTLLEAAARLPRVRFFLVGGTPTDVTRYRADYADKPNITFVGHVSHELMPLWQGAADVLVLPNTAREAIASRYTSPMKLFEYMASERVIVASRLPAITELIDESSAFLFEADDSVDLARAVGEALTSREEADERAARARTQVSAFSWEKRAERLMEVSPFLMT